jgi:hypothetical protein
MRKSQFGFRDPLNVAPSTGQRLLYQMLGSHRAPTFHNNIHRGNGIRAIRAKDEQLMIHFLRRKRHAGHLYLSGS